MKRYVVVDWETKTVFLEAYDTNTEAWRAMADKALRENRSPYEFDAFVVEIEPK